LEGQRRAVGETLEVIVECRAVVEGDRSKGKAPATSPVSTGLPASIPSDMKSRIWAEAGWVTSGPGLKLKSSDPAVPEIEEVSTLTS